MLPMLVMPLLLLASCSGVPDVRRLQIDKSGIRDHTVRDKRMVFGLLQRVRRLLGLATPVNSKTAVREYVMTGDFRKALKDFSWVQPSDFKYLHNKPNGVFEKEGTVVDQLMVLSNGGKTGKPTIEFRNRKEVVGNDDVTDRITYVGKIP